MEMLTLSNGVKMPFEGYGVFQIQDKEMCKNGVLNAIKSGYRLIDTAASYLNEEAVGEAIKQAIDEGIVTREEIFVTTKLWVQDYSYEKAKIGFEKSIEKLGLSYIDLYLLHQPYGDSYVAWKALEELYREGKFRAIGVSNFNKCRFTEFAEVVDVKPMVNQVELHPFFSQYDLIEVMKEYGCQPQAWGPLTEGKHNIFNHPVLKEIGDKYGKTPAQVALKWNVQRGVSVIPKSVHLDRIKENINIWDFELSDDDMKKIDTLDTGKSEIIDHNDPAIIKFILGHRID